MKKKVYNTPKVNVLAQIEATQAVMLLVSGSAPQP